MSWKLLALTWDWAPDWLVLVLPAVLAVVISVVVCVLLAAHEDRLDDV